MAEIFAAAVKRFGHEVETNAFFDTVTLHVPGRAHALLAKAKEKEINIRFVDADRLGIAFDQSTRRIELTNILSCFVRQDGRKPIDLDALIDEIDACARGCHPEGAQAQDARSSPIPSSRCITRKPRCCAISAISKPRTWRSIAR